MPALNFQEQFAEAVEKGWKRQTIRKVRKRPIEPGDTLQLYVGMRTKKCRKLREETCTNTWPIAMDEDFWRRPPVRTYRISIDGIGLYSGAAESLARADGFASVREMLKWFDKTHGLPFEGVLIQW